MPTKVKTPKFDGTNYARYKKLVNIWKKLTEVKDADNPDFARRFKFARSGFKTISALDSAKLVAMRVAMLDV